MRRWLDSTVESRGSMIRWPDSMLENRGGMIDVLTLL